MSPVQIPPKKKLEGSFLKRNWWIFPVVIVIGIMGAGTWFVYRGVKAIKKAYSENIYADSDSVTRVDTIAATGPVLAEPYNDSIETATLNITGGGSTLELKDTTSDLFSARTSGHIFHLGKLSSARHCVLNFNSKFQKTENGKTYVADIRLNMKPVWNFDIDVGASDLDFDLSKFRIGSMKIKGGAGEFKVKLGRPAMEETNIGIETGAAETDLQIPSNVACRIHINSTLSSNTFEGFEKKDDGVYETPGFAAGKNKIYIEMNGGISDFKVSKY